MAGQNPLQCTEEDDEYPPPIAIENLDSHTATIGAVQNLKPKVYISHAREASTYVNYLRDIMVKYHGYQTHDILTLEEDSIGGLSTTRNIRTLVERCKKMIVVVSKNYTNAHWTTYEMATILQSDSVNIADADIIPIISNDGSTVNELPDEISMLVPLHASDRSFIRRLGQSLEYSSNR